MINFLLVLILALVTLSISTILFFLFWKIKVLGRIRNLEAEVFRLEQMAFSRSYTRLNVFKKRLGVVYIDSLPVSNEPEVVRLFDAGVRFAEQGMWDKACLRWNEAKAKAKGEALAGLYFLCGGCMILSRREQEAEQELLQARSIARKSHNRAAQAAVNYMLASLLSTRKEYKGAKRLLRETIAKCKRIGDVELMAEAWVRLAVVQEAERLFNEAIGSRRQALRLFENIGNHGAASVQYRVMGDLFLVQRDFDKARASYEDGLHLARKSRNHLGEAENLLGIGTVHRLQREYRRAIDALDRSLHIYRDINFIRGQAQALCELALAHENNGKTDIAREFFEQGLFAARRIKDNRLIIRNLTGLAVNCMLHYNYERAKLLVEEAVTLSRQINDPEELAGTLIVHSRLFLSLGKTTEAIAALTQAFELSQAQNDRRHEAKVLLELARATRITGDSRQAQQRLERFKSVAKYVIDDVLEADGWVEAGLILAQKNDWENALDLLNQALTKHQEMNMQMAVAVDLLHIGTVLISAGRLEAAKDKLQLGLKIAQEVGDIGLEARFLSALGNAVEQYDAEDAIMNYNQALSCYRMINDLSGQALCLQKLGVLLAKENQLVEARLTLEQALRLCQQIEDHRGGGDN